VTKGLEIRPADKHDAAELATTMRDADLDEIEANTGLAPLGVLMGGISMSAECWVAIYKSQVMAMWGVVPIHASFLAGRLGTGWLLTSDLVDRYPKAFWWACQHELASLLERWSGLTNAIDTRHTKAIRWAQRLGFRLDGPQPHGRLGLPFQRFWVAKEDLHVRARNDCHDLGRSDRRRSEPVRQEDAG